ncbi:FAD-dependent oxidoreductase [Candidatus Marinimicrobia bacterium]|nr:FAD-dependent oxidoreductase [Candidatus Neomarinimicrobiota bacterium]
MNTNNIKILGGGPAGIALAHYLSKSNIDFDLFEASSEIGGNAKTLQFDKFYFDTGAHRWHDKNTTITSEIKKIMGGDLKLVTAPSKIFWNNKFINFPITPMNLLKSLPLKILIKIFLENISRLFQKSDYSNFESMVYSQYGKTLSDLFLTNYSKKLWGLKSHKLLNKVSGNRLKGLSLMNLLKEIFYKSKLQRHLDGSFYYPKYGFGTIFSSITNEIDANSIHLNSLINSISHRNKKITQIGIKNNPIKITNERIISTLPINLLIKMITPPPPKAILDIAESIKFRGLILTVIQLDKPIFSENASIYFPEQDIPFNRIYEPKNRSSELSPTNQTCIVVESSLNQNEIEKTDTMAFRKRIEKSLLATNLVTNKEIIKSKTIKLNYAYPIMDIKSKEKLEILLRYLKEFKNMDFIGRNSLFTYTHTHNLFEEAKELVKNYTNPNYI